MVVSLPFAIHLITGRGKSQESISESIAAEAPLQTEERGLEMSSLEPEHPEMAPFIKDTPTQPFLSKWIHTHNFNQDSV